MKIFENHLKSVLDMFENINLKEYDNKLNGITVILKYLERHCRHNR